MAATEEQVAAWYAEALEVAGRFLRRRYHDATEAQREEWASEVAVDVAMRWREEGAPAHRGAQLAYIRTSAHRRALDEVDAKRNKIFGAASSWDESAGQDEGEASGALSVEAQLDVMRRRGWMSTRLTLAMRGEALLEAGAARLREVLDRLAWEKSSREEVHFWLLWLMDVRRVVGERLRAEEDVPLAPFAEALAGLVRWHEAEQAQAICGEGPTLGRFWQDAVAVLHSEGELEQQAICDVFGRLGEQVSMDRLHQWQRRMRLKVKASCDAQGVTYEELRAVLGFVLAREV